MEEKISFVALGGLDTNGNNCFCVEINDDIFVVSCGIGYPDKFESGIDFVIPDYSYLKENKNRVRAYFITHGHDDTVGALSYFYSIAPAPIYMSSFTRYIFNYILKSNKQDINNFDIHLVKPSDEFYVANRKITYFETAHSVPDTSGVAIASSKGNIVFSGDYIIEYTSFDRFKFDFKAVSKLADDNNYLLLMNSLNCTRKGYTSPSHKATSYVSEAVNEASGRLFVALYSQRIYNVVETIYEALNDQRKIYLYDEETKAIIKSLLDEGIISLKEDDIIKSDAISSFKDSNICVLIIGMGDILYQKISMLALRDIKDKRLYLEESDTFLLLCPPSSNFEVMAVSVLDELYKTNCHVINISKKQIIKMHPSEDDIKLFISLIHPKFFIPIKGQYKDLIANAEIATSMNVGLNHKNVILLDCGMKATFNNDIISVASIENEKVRVGSLMVDGIGVGDVANDIILERNQLSQDGIIVMSLLVSLSEKKIVGGPDIQMRGYLYLKESEGILKSIENLFVDIVNKHLSSDNFDTTQCKDEIIETVSRFTRKSTLRNPVIEPEILIIE